MTEDELKTKLVEILTDEDIIYPQHVSDHILELFRVAGWSPPVASNLRAVEKCTLECRSSSGNTRCTKDGLQDLDGRCTITRPLTQEETNEVAEQLTRLYYFDHCLSSVTLASGAKVILVEDNDAKG